MHMITMGKAGDRCDCRSFYAGNSSAESRQVCLQLVNLGKAKEKGAIADLSMLLTLWSVVDRCDC